MCANKIYYYSEEVPNVDGTYWHMVGELPVIWDSYKIMFIGNSFTYYPKDVYGVNNPGVAALTKELADALKQITKALGDEVAVNNVNQWLEVCVYYSAYGTNGKELELPTVGVCPFEPIMFEGNGIDKPATASGMIDRIILPRGIIFGFIPEKSGVYKFYSAEQLETQGWVCNSDGVVIADSDFGLREFAAILTNGGVQDSNFVSYVYLEKGQMYLFRAGFYDINEVPPKVSIKIDSLTTLSFSTSSKDKEAANISTSYDAILESNYLTDTHTEIGLNTDDDMCKDLNKID